MPRSSARPSAWRWVSCERDAGPAQFSDDRIHSAAVLQLAGKIRYQINPGDDYPRSYTGHLLATLTDGSRREFRQPNLRGGAHAPLSDADVERKFMNNAAYGGWSPALAERLLTTVGMSAGRSNLFSPPRLDAFSEFRV